MSGLNGDFLGFTFITNGEAHKSQDLGITRVSDGDRYNETLIPEIEDKTIEIPGLDGTYFYGSDFKTRNFSIKIAFDSMTEENFRTMRRVFGYKHMGLLIFDEAPYKQYKVKVASPPELEYVCFDERSRQEGETIPNGGITWHTEEVQQPIVDDEGEPVMNDDDTPAMETVQIRVRDDITPWEYSEGTQRIYKGEGTIEFIAYYPFAKMVTKFADEYDNDNKNEWLGVSGLKDSTWFDSEGVDEYVDSAGAINVYNPGDIETGFKLFIPFGANGTIPTFTLTYKDQVLNISEITRKEEDVIVDGDIEPGSIGVQINTDNGLIEGIWKRTENASEINNMFVTSGQIYNECATGEFFKIQPSDQIQEIGITIDPGDMEIYYDYLYF